MPPLVDGSHNLEAYSGMLRGSFAGRRMSGCLLFFVFFFFITAERDFPKLFFVDSDSKARSFSCLLRYLTVDHVCRLTSIRCVRT